MLDPVLHSTIMAVGRVIERIDYLIMLTATCSRIACSNHVRTLAICNADERILSVCGINGQVS